MPINYFLASIISFLGLLLGIILIKFAPEEQKPGKKYFMAFKTIISILVVLVFIIFSKFNVFAFTGLLVFVLLLFNKKFKNNDALIYLVLGTILALSYKNINLFLIESVLIFLYGIPAASLTFNVKKKNYIEVFKKNIWFFIPIIIIYFII
jgi:hypothetical protein|tara:strand:- start:355 stop:807 length:453 start_codon:yes stop_codon:yes gene_type:complete